MSDRPKSGPLASIGVLVTRPEPQGVPLCRLLEAAGAVAWRFPLIETRPATERRHAASKLGPLERFDFIVFTSANSVRYGAELMDQRRDLHLAAIGPATARALNQAGYRVELQPVSSFDSEGLLALPGLQHLAGRRVLIVKGRGGRDLLERAFGERGAAVHRLEVYERLPAQLSPAALAELTRRLAAGELQVVTVTSVDIAERLADLCGRLKREPGATTDPWAALDELHWLVPGARVAGAVRALGISAALIEAASAEDQSLIGALLAWRAALSGA